MVRIRLHRYANDFGDVMNQNSIKIKISSIHFDFKKNIKWAFN
jgi:hypothetical protein